MRFPAAGLLALCACNQLYGLDSTRHVDAGNPDAAPPRVKLSYQVATTAKTGAVPMPAPVTFVDFEPTTRVRIGPLDGDLIDRPYVDGSIEVAPEMYAMPWRLEYTVPGMVPHEVQWHPAQGRGHIAIPRFGRMPGAPIPAGSSYEVTTSPSHTFANAFVYTTGVSNEGSIGPHANPVQINASVLRGMSGEPSAPDGAQNDFVVLADYTSGTPTACPRRMEGAALAKASDLMPGAKTTITGTYSGALEGTEVEYSTKVGFGAFTDALGSRRASHPPVAGVLIGQLFARNLPAFTRELESSLSPLARIPAPHMLLLADCSFAQTPDAHARPLNSMFPKAVVAYTVNARSVGNTLLVSSVVSVVIDQVKYEPSFVVPFAKAATLDGVTPPLDLTNQDGVELGATTGRLTLSFTDDEIPGESFFDYFEVELYRIDRAMTRPILERVYISTTSTKSITIDPAVFESGREYAFAIKTYRGAQGMLSNDFTLPRTNPQTVGTIFFRPFKKL